MTAYIYILRLLFLTSKLKKKKYIFNIQRMIPLQFSTWINIGSLNRQGILKKLNLFTLYGDDWLLILFCSIKSGLVSKEVITNRKTKPKMN